MASNEREYHPIVDEFVRDHRHTKAEGTLSGYRYASQQFNDWLDLDDSISKRDYDGLEVNQATLEDYLNWLLDDYPRSTVKTRYYNLSSFFAWLDDKNIIEEDPTDEFDISDYIDRGYTKQGEVMRAKEGVIYLSEEEFEKLVQHVPTPQTRNELMLKLMWQTGLRPSELVKIRLNDIDHEERRIPVQTAKTGKIRDVWYKTSLTLLLDQWRNSDRNAMPTSDESNYLFISRYSSEMSSNRPNRVVGKAAERAGIQEITHTDAAGSKQRKINAKSLRHSFAVHSVKNGMDIRSLQILMGHEKISTTEKYLRFADETLREKMMRHGPE